MIKGINVKKRSILLALVIWCISFTSVKLYAQEAIIYLDSTQQVIRGFGAANILPWRPDMTATEIVKAFGTEDGQIGFSILRLRIPPDTYGFAANVATAQAAHAMGATIIASPWSPPDSMKTNGSPVGGRLLESSYDDFAAHLKSFVDYMADNGVPIHAVSVQNEPDVSVTYESCDYNAAEMLKFMQENAPSVGTGVFAPESYHFDHSLSDPILNDSTATANTAFIGGHIYGGGLVPYPLAESKGKEIWMTEHLSGQDDYTNNWSWSLAVAKEINACMNAGMSAYIWWYIVRYYGPISDGEHTAYGRKGTVTKKGYVMSQFARFIRPGFVRVAATYNPQAQVYVTAYKSDSDIVIVAVNESSASVSQTFSLPDLADVDTAFTPYVTSETKNCIQESDINMSGGSLTALLDSRSITTFVSTDYISGTVEGAIVPETFNLYQNYPNPFNPATTIRYDLPQAGNAALTVYDLLGQEVTRLVDGHLEPGYHRIQWDGRDANSRKVPSGIYIATLVTPEYSTSIKMLLLK